MAIDVVYEPRPGETREYSTTDKDVKNIVPREDKVVIHLKGETFMIPFNRVFELRVDLDEETLENV